MGTGALFTLGEAAEGMTDGMNRTLQHQAQEKNRARISRASRHLKLSLNAAIKDDAQELIHVHVRLSIILWMSWLESSVLWLASHPKLAAAARDSIFVDKRMSHEKKWRTLLEHLTIGQPVARANQIKTMIEWVISDVKTYAEVRNKLAHGQWDTCLTSNNDKRNPEITKRVLELNKGDILRLKAVAEKLVDLTMLLITGSASFDAEFTRSVARVEKARRDYSGDVDWLVAEIRRRRRE